MLRFTAPTADELRAFATAAAAQAYGYADVGATRLVGTSGFAAPRGFLFDRCLTRLGSGAELFEAAAAAILAGRMFPTGWVRTALPDRPIAAGDVLAVSARCVGSWWTNAARVVFTVDEADDAGRRRGFAYGTLQQHAERGEERFVVEHRPDDTVWYDLSAFSRPRHPLVFASYPLARRLQARFRRDSAEALRRAVADVPGALTDAMP